MIGNNAVICASLQVAKKASVLRKRKSKLKLDASGVLAGLGGGGGIGGIGATPGGLSTSQINVSNNPTAAESEEVLCFDPNEEHRSGNHDMIKHIIPSKGSKWIHF